MAKLLGTLRCAALACLIAGLAPDARGGDGPPNWRGGGTGSTAPAGPVHADELAGKSTHLGRFTGAGAHVLYADFTFDGWATWTAANGDTLDVVYAGQVFPSGDPDYPYGFVAELWAVGGTGRLAGASGAAAMTGAFTGVPGDLYFEIEGTLRVGGP